MISDNYQQVKQMVLGDIMTRIHNYVQPSSYDEAFAKSSNNKVIVRMSPMATAHRDGRQILARTNTQIREFVVVRWCDSPPRKLSRDPCWVTDERTFVFDDVDLLGWWNLPA